MHRLTRRCTGWPAGAPVDPSVHRLTRSCTGWPAGAPVDPQVNEAETERLESEVAHRDTAAVFNEAEQLAHTLHKELKRNITKSRYAIFF